MKIVQRSNANVGESLIIQSIKAQFLFAIFNSRKKHRHTSIHTLYNIPTLCNTYKIAFTTYTYVLLKSIRSIHQVLAFELLIKLCRRKIAANCESFNEKQNHNLFHFSGRLFVVYVYCHIMSVCISEACMYAGFAVLRIRQLYTYVQLYMEPYVNIS